MEESLRRLYVIYGHEYFSAMAVAFSQLQLEKSHSIPITLAERHALFFL